MNLDDLKQNFKQQIVNTESNEQIKESLKMLEQKIETTDKQIKRRDKLEITIALLLIPVWIFGLFISASTIQSIGFIVAILSCIFIPYKMTKAKQIQQPKNKSVKAFLESERQKVLQQINILESIFWWYLGPLGLAIGLMAIGAKVDESGLPIISISTSLYLIFVAVLYAGIYVMNKKAAKTKFTPLLNNIESKIEELNKHD